MPLKAVGKEIPDISKATAKLKRDLPILIANMAKNHYLEGFRRGGYQTDASRTGWKQRKSNRKSIGRAILVRTGQLRNDIDVRKTTFEQIILGTNDVPYASYHNEGTEKMPQREFLGDSRMLDLKVNKLITRKMQSSYKVR